MHPERVCTIIAPGSVLFNICVTKIPLPRQHHQLVQEEDAHPVVPAVQEDVGGRLVHAHIVNAL